MAEKSGVSLNIENIFLNGCLSTPDEMNAFVDSFGSKGSDPFLSAHVAIPVA